MQWHANGYKVVDGKITICEEQRKLWNRYLQTMTAGGGRQDRPEPEREKHMQ